MVPMKESNKIITYPDSDVTVNVIKEEGERSKFAMTFFSICLNNSKILLLTSDIMYKEVHGVCEKQNLGDPEKSLFYKLIKNRKNKIEIFASKEEIELSIKYGGKNHKDLLHYILAKNYSADYLVSNNIRHMELVKEIYDKEIHQNQKEIKIVLPKDYPNIK
ncbi:MAG: hypothetical protein PHT27_04425 [Candidatus Izemoplasmatales bacterium]|nr:hypothetical protein [Candidatus Izemoplasmatales bacterium]